MVFIVQVQSNPYKMFAAYLVQPSWPSRPKTKGTLLNFLKLYNFGFYVIFVGSTSSEVQHPWSQKSGANQKNKKIIFQAQFWSTFNQ